MNDAVERTRDRQSSWWKSIGPALITACVVFGPGSLLVSSNVGANYGYELALAVAADRPADGDLSDDGGTDRRLRRGDAVHADRSAVGTTGRGGDRHHALPDLRRLSVFQQPGRGPGGRRLFPASGRPLDRRRLQCGGDRVPVHRPSNLHRAGTGHEGHGRRDPRLLCVQPDRGPTECGGSAHGFVPSLPEGIELATAEESGGGHSGSR